MVTISFVADFTTKPWDLTLTQEGYHFYLSGKECLPSQAELDYIFDQTPAVLTAMEGGTMSDEIKGEFRVKVADRSIVRSTHYTWNVKRVDGQPISPQELTYAFASRAFIRLAEKSQPTVSLPLSALKDLLDADKSVSAALVSAIANADCESGELIIDDQEHAASLVDTGFAVATGKPGRYVLSTINVT